VLKIANVLNDFFSAVFIEEDKSDIPKCESKTNVKCPDPIFDECIIQLKFEITRD
jgi:hypothetical protein